MAATPASPLLDDARHVPGVPSHTAVTPWFDVDALERAAPDAEDAPSLEYALGLWRGPILEGEGVRPWIEPHRERSAQLLADARMGLAALYMVQGRTRDAASLYHAVVLADELREDAHRLLMAAWAELGQRPRALRHYEALATLLHSELQAAPEPETVSLYESLRAAEAS